MYPVWWTLSDEKKLKLTEKNVLNPGKTPGFINATIKKRWLFEQSLKYGTIESENK